MNNSQQQHEPSRRLTPQWRVVLKRNSPFSYMTNNECPRELLADLMSAFFCLLANSKKPGIKPGSS